MGASQIALEQLLRGDALRARKPGSLLAGASARLTRASELTLPARAAAPLSGSAGGPLERLLGPLPKGTLVELVGRRSSATRSRWRRSRR